MRNKKSIYFIGDSLIERGKWQKLLPSLFCSNYGVAGDTLEGLIKRIDTLPEDNPDYVILQIGINDIIVSKLKKRYSNSKIVVQTLLPAEESEFSFIKSINKSIKKCNSDVVKAQKEEGCLVLDIYPHFFDKRRKEMIEEYSIDGLHLSKSGYVLWAKVVKEFVGRY
ncbi:MAG: hypothetical protein B6226_01090 [Candidatus Cloacimonetes bacterium 4572_65]|nr:MAG: hypothetical protein B6226_01090 [Candidatus Cloacimonetes bacterium 4572_65]